VFEADLLVDAVDPRGFVHIVLDAVRLRDGALFIPRSPREAESIEVRIRPDACVFWFLHLSVSISLCRVGVFHPHLDI
jgi:hypothetical protein